MCALTHDSREVWVLDRNLSKVLDTHLLVLASCGDTWLTWLTTVPYTFCGLNMLHKTRNSRHTAAKCLSYIMLGSPYHEHFKRFVSLIFRKAWHVSIHVYSITTELYLSSALLSIMWHKAKGTNINNSCVTRFTCIFVNAPNYPEMNRNFEELLIYMLKQTMEQHYT